MMTTARHSGGSCLWIAFLAHLLFVSFGPAAVAADEASAEESVATDAGDGDDAGQLSFGGPGSTASQILSDEQLGKQDCQKGLASHLRLYCDFKKALHRENGIRFGVDYNALIQGASESPGEDLAAGGVFRLFGTWTLLDPDAGGTGFLTFKAENRHRLGTAIAPQALGGEFGYVGLTALPFGDAGTVLTNFYWEQSLLADRLAYVFGIVDVTDYVSVYGLVNPWTDFSNLVFSTDPTIPVPDQGLGTAVRRRFGRNYYVVAGLADANGDPSDPLDAFDSFFGEGELFKHVEVGRYGAWEDRVDDNVHLTLWQVDERTEAAIPSGWGAALSFSTTLHERWLTFLRLGYGDGGGALLERSISTGVAHRKASGRGVFGLGVNWGRPNHDLFGADAQDQYTLEAYYRLQLGTHMSITPDIQVVKDPALGPGQDVVWVVGLRARVFF
jgi:porin